MSDTSAASNQKAKPQPKSKYDYTNGPAPLEINMSWCKACNICIALCPTQVFEPNRDGRPIQARPDACTQCSICWIHCPDFAITSNYK